MEKVYVVEVSYNIEGDSSPSFISRIYRNVADAVKYISERTGVSEDELLKQLNEDGFAYASNDVYVYDISEHVLE